MIFNNTKWGAFRQKKKYIQVKEREQQVNWLAFFRASTVRAEEQEELNLIYYVYIHIHRLYSLLPLQLTILTIDIIVRAARESFGVV